MKRKLFSGSGILMLVCMILAVAVINAAANTPKEDGTKNVLGNHPWLSATLAGVCVWLIDYFFDAKGRDKFSKFASEHSESLLA